MQPTKSRLLHDTLRRYLRRQAWGHLDKVLAKTRVEDLAGVLTGMAEREQVIIFERLKSSEDKANLIISMQPPFGKRVLDPMEAPDAAEILREMAQDDMADILGDLEPEQAARVLEILDEADGVELLMGFAQDTAGGIMLPEFVAVSADMTAEEALIALRESGDDIEMVYYIYVVNEHGHLVGVLSLRKLVVAPAHKRLREIMETEILSVTTDTDQEEVARLVSEYDLLAIPVVDDANRLVGIVTVDDVIDVLQEEAEEDMLRMAGVGTTYVGPDAGIFANLRMRMPWLIASAFGGLLAAAAMGSFDEVLEAHHYLALFLPIILGMAGNVGSQAATVTVRGLAIGHIRSGDFSFKAIRKEATIGLSMGMVYGSVVGTVGGLASGTLAYGLSIGLALTCGMILSSTMGTVMPLTLARLHIDPAVATMPLVSTSTDVLGVITYFTIATQLMRFFGIA